MMLDCKYCGGTGKLHDDADAFDGHEVEALKAEIIAIQAETTRQTDKRIDAYRALEKELHHLKVDDARHIAADRETIRLLNVRIEAMAKVVEAAEEVSSTLAYLRKSPHRLQNSDSYALNDLRDALAALAPATSKETP